MGVTYRTDTGNKKRRASIEHGGESKSAHFPTALEAQIMLTSRKNLRAAAAARRRQEEAQRNFLAPCGTITMAGSHSPNSRNRRCASSISCIHYDDCLTVAALRNWPGWKVKPTK